MKENKIMYVTMVTDEFKDKFDEVYKNQYGLNTKKDVIFIFSTVAKDLGKDYLKSIDQRIFKQSGNRRYAVTYEGYEAEYIEEVKESLGIKKKEHFLKYLMYLVINYKEVI